MTDRDDAPPADDHATGPDGPDAPPVHERWWWTGTFRAVLGGIVVGYQWPVLTSGDASTWNWVLAAVGAVIVVWGASMVLTEYRRRS